MSDLTCNITLEPELAVNIELNAVGATPGRFLNLTDVDETTFVGHAGDMVRVNLAENKLEFGVGAYTLLPATASVLGGVKGGDRITIAADGTISADVQTSPMVYPGAGIPVSTGAAWGASIANNSANWNTAYGWGSHAGLYSLLVHVHTGTYLPVAGAGDIYTHNASEFLTSVTAHNILSATHGDTTVGACARGSVIVGDSGDKWSRLAFPASPAGKVLIATATDIEWSGSALGSAAYTATTAYEVPLTFGSGLTRTVNAVANDLITGKAGGQTITGGTAASETLTIRSTNHATKGKILFGTSAYDEVNNRLGLGTVNPSSGLELMGVRGSWIGTAGGNQASNLTILNPDSAIYTGASILFAHYYSGSASCPAGSISMVRLAGSGSSAVESSMVFRTTGGLSDYNGEKLRILYNGNIGIGITAPTARLHLPAGTASPSTSPLKFTSGPRLNTAEAGAMEFLTDDYYLTITTGAARKGIVLNDGTNLTSGRIPVAFTNGRLIDDADLTFVTDTLTSTKVKTVTPLGYAEMYMYENVTACAIDVANAYHAIYNSFGNNDGTLAPQIDTSYFTYNPGVGYAIASVANYNSPTNTQIKCTVTAGHALLAGEPVTITGSTDYDGTYLVLAAGLSGTEFVVTKAYTQTRTGSVRRPATLKALVAGIYNTAFTVSGSCESSNDLLKFELNKDITALDNICGNALWTTATTYQTISGSGLMSVTANQYIWLSVKNNSGAGDVTIRNANVNIRRII